ncbi:MAG TPA: putative Ig domain-containing protein, partial [Solirubrobacteraceae bacterium]|nr:putative Ig domain-containing protein [Solirubrobacteraceae bacterium]
SIAVSPGSVAGGAGATATATLNVAAPAGGAVVSLVSSNTGAAKVPASVTVPAGATSASFAVSTANPGTTTTVALGGTYGGNARAALLGVTGTRGGAVLPAPPSGVFIDPPWLDPTPEGANGTVQITWFGSLSSLTLTVASGSLPPGETLISPFRPLTAALQGIPTIPGTYAFVMKFTDASGSSFAWPYVWQIGPPAPLVVDQANFGPGTVGQAYDGGFFYGGGVAPYTWSIAAGALPPGLRLNSSTSEVTGTPTTPGTYAFTARLTDAKGATLDTPETITVS